MKILLYTDTFCVNYTTFIYNEVIGLKNKGHEILYVCSERVNEKIFPLDNVTVIPFVLSDFSKKLHFLLEINDLYLSFYDSKFSEELNEVINKFDPEIIHCNFGYQALKVLENMKRDDIPVVITFHGYDATFKLNRNTYVKKMREYLSRKNVFTFVVTDYFRIGFESKKIPLDKTTTVHCGIDTRLFKRKSYNQNKQPFVFIQVSSFYEKKGHDITVEAFKRFTELHSDFNCKLIFAGDGPNYEKIKKLVNDRGLSDLISFTGVVTLPEAKELMEHAHAFLHHSITSESGDMEGIPTSIMEAMAMELPIVATWHSGISELVEHGVNGFLVKEKDIDDYVQKMWEITKWDYKPENKTRVEQHFSLDLHIETVEKEFSRIASLFHHEPVQ